MSVLIYSRHPALTPSHQATLARPAVDAIRTTKPFIRTRFAASDAARMGSSGTVPRLRSGYQQPQFEKSARQPDDPLRVHREFTARFGP